MMKSIDEVLSSVPKIFLTGMICLFLAHVGFMILLFVFDHDYVFGLSPLFALDAENTIPAWFSTIILFSSSFFLYIIYRVTSESNPDIFWLILAIIFLVLSLDEMISLHERMDQPIKEQYNFEGYLYFSWVVVGIFLTLLVSVFSIPFLKRLPPKAAIHFILSGALFVLGAIGMEMMGSNEQFMAMQSTVDGGLQPASESVASLKNSFSYMVMITLEETLEMCGIVFFNYALVRYLRFAINNNDEY